MKTFPFFLLLLSTQLSAAPFLVDLMYREGILQPEAINEGDSFSIQSADSFAVDGEYAVVGSPYYTTNGESLGSLFVYKREFGYRPDSKIAYSPPASPDTIDSEFGHAVAISGNHVYVGAPYFGNYNTPKGAVYVYDIATSTLNS
ncbi:MAG: hypothetical protein ACR2RV_20135, partial [Verrucomicrobiales bacterium]